MGERNASSEAIFALSVLGGEGGKFLQIPSDYRKALILTGAGETIKLRAEAKAEPTAAARSFSAERDLKASNIAGEDLVLGRAIIDPVAHVLLARSVVGDGDGGKVEGGRVRNLLWTTFQILLCRSLLKGSAFLRL